MGNSNNPGDKPSLVQQVVDLKKELRTQQGMIDQLQKTNQLLMEAMAE